MWKNAWLESATRSFVEKPPVSWQFFGSWTMQQFLAHHTSSHCISAQCSRLRCCEPCSIASFQPLETETLRKTIWAQPGSTRTDQKQIHLGLLPGQPDCWHSHTSAWVTTSRRLLKCLPISDLNLRQSREVSWISERDHKLSRYRWGSWLMKPPRLNVIKPIIKIMVCTLRHRRTFRQNV